MSAPEQSVASIGFHPAVDDRILLAGTESDIETMRIALATLAPKARGQVFIEVQSQADVAELAAPSRFSISWLVRDRGQSLRRSVDAWLSEMLPVTAFDDHTVYAWIAGDGEARVLRSN
ncbi:MAG: SIP domain-containing protein [Microbacteriaceae bacterium]